MADSGDTILVGFIVTIVLIGLIGGVAIGLFICFKWRDCVKRRQVIPNVVHSRQPTRRNRRVRVQGAVANNTSNNTCNAMLDSPPAYSEFDDRPPPPYSRLYPNIFRQGSSRATTRGSSGMVTPVAGTRRDSTARNSSFSMHINTGSTNTPMVTPTGNMFTSSVVNTRELSAISDCRQTNDSDVVV